MIYAISCLILGAFAWLVSDSLIPLVVMLVGWGIAAGVTAVCRGVSCLFTICWSVLLAAVVVFFFARDMAGVSLEALPWVFYFAFAGGVWSWLTTSFVKDPDRHVEASTFWVALFSSLILVWLGGSLVIYRMEPWPVRLLSSVPFISLMAWKLGVGRSRWWAALVGTVVLGGVLTYSHAFSTKLTNWFSPEIDFEAQSAAADFGNEEQTSGDEGTTTKLPRRTNIQPDPSVRFLLHVDRRSDFHRLIKGSVYMRTSAVSRFDGNETIAPLEVNLWRIDEDDGFGDGLVFLDEGAGDSLIDYSVIAGEKDLRQFPHLVGLHAVRVSGLYEFADGWLRVTSTVDSPMVRVRAASDWGSVTPVSDAAVRSASRFHPTYLQMPNTMLARRIDTLADRQFGDLQSEKVPAAVADYLSNACEYSLSYENPKDLTPVENLLFDERKGQCELFAAAGALLLRSQQVPCRIAYGYAGGQFDSDKQLIAFRESDFHAWVEVLDENNHWRIVDMTPASGTATSRTPMASHLSGQEFPDFDVSAFPELGIDSAMATTVGATGSRTPFGLALAVGLVVVLGGIIWSITRKKSARGTSKSIKLKQNKRDRGLPGYMQEWLKLGKELDAEKLPSQTYAEFADNLRAKGVSSDVLNRAVGYWYNVSYSEGQQDANTEKELASAIKAEGNRLNC
ncbi:MAG: transglutaminase-like domain-containing protein [Verrucomicrobiota bacterium]